MKTIGIVFLGLLLMSGVTSAMSGPAVTGGLVTYYSFDGFATGGASVADESGNGYNGVVTGTLTSVASGKVGKSVQFAPPVWDEGYTKINGQIGNDVRATSVVDLPVGSLSGTPSSALTIAAWIKTPASPAPVNGYTFDQEVFSARIGTTMMIHMETKNTGGYRFVLRGATGTKIFDTTFNLGDTTNFEANGSPIWQHFAVSYDKNAPADQINVYFNGSQVAGAPLSVLDIGSPWDRAVIGGTADNLIRPFVGEMDEYYLFNRALGAGEIGTLYNAVPEPSSMIALLSGLVGIGGMVTRRKRA